MKSTQKSLAISHESYMKVRNKQTELIDVSKQNIQIRDITDLLVNSLIDSIHLEKDGDGWILSTDPEPIDPTKLVEEEPKSEFVFGKKEETHLVIKGGILRRSLVTKKEVTNE